jgi:O-methyltransferase domain/Dimerisation domain
MADNASGVAHNAQSAIPPPLQLLDLAAGLWRSRALAVAAELEVADLLANGPLHINELASRTNTHAQSLFRMLRALESIGVFHQGSPRVFANTQLSHFLRKEVPGSQWAAVRLAFSTDLGEFDAWTGLMGSIQSGQIAFNKIHGYSFWEFLKCNPKQEAIFGEAMRSMTVAGTPMITAAYDWSRFPVIADIGGGIGTQLVDILNAHPSCRGILFDQPDVEARAIPHDRIERVGGNFFDRVPTGADAYILRAILHDWADPEAIAILKTVRAAAKPGARVIFMEQVIKETPEYGLHKWLDLVMLTVLGGQERTMAEYTYLLDEAGLELERTISMSGPAALIISRPRA